MGSLPILRASGLQTAHNPFSGVPDGALRIAKNVVVYANFVIEPRRGHKQLSYTLSSTSKAAAFYGTTLYTQHGTSSLAYDTGSAFSAVSGTYTPVDDASLRMKFVEARQNLYFNTSTGVKAVRSSGSAPVNAGLPQPPITNETALGGATGNGFVTPNSQIAFRLVYGIRDTNGNEILGPPSERIVLANPADLSCIAGTMVRTGGLTVTVTSANHGFSYLDSFTVSPGEANFAAGTYTVASVSTNTFTYEEAGANGSNGSTQTLSMGTREANLYHAVPSEFTTSHFVRVYRSDLSGSASDAPGDELFLSYERKISSADISGNLGTLLLDSGKAVLSTTALYTNPRQDGILQANYRPPIAKDMCWWASRMWFANTTSKHRAYLEILGTGSPNGVQAADTLTLAGSAYRAVASPVGMVSGDFLFFTTYGVSRNVRETAKDLRRRVNETAGATVRGFYVSADDDSQGKLLFEETDLGGSAFTMFGSRIASWNPELTTTSSGALTSDNNRLPNGLFYSKPDQPEAVPLINYLLVGAKNKEILRVVPLREKLYVFKEDGIFTVAGEEPFRVDQLDSQTRLVCPDSAVVLNNQILCLTNQGVVAVSDAGVQLVSRPVEDQLLPYLTSAMRSTVKRYAFGVAHETDRVYELWLPESGETSCSTALVYNTITNAWTKWEVETGRTFGAADSTDIRYYGGDSSKVLKERRDFAVTDYADETLAVTISDISGDEVTVSSSTGVTAGDVLALSSGGVSQTAVITAISGNTLTLAEDVVAALTGVSSGTVHIGFECDVQYTPIAFDRPGTEKRFTFGTLHFGPDPAFTLGKATYKTEISRSVETSEATSPDGWGTQAWGASPWGDDIQNFSFRHTVPLEKQRAAMLYPGFRIREAYGRWKLHGVTIETEETSERTGM